MEPQEYASLVEEFIVEALEFRRAMQKVEEG